MSHWLKSNDVVARPYIIAVVPATLAVTLAEVKEQLRIDSADTSQDTFLTVLINASIEYAERFTKRDFITRTIETFRDSFGDSLEIRRSPVQSIVSVEYLKDDVLTLVATTVYFLTADNIFQHLSLKVGESFPTDEDLREQSVKITFKSGYGDAPTDVPDSLRQGLLEHISSMYENRGDCTDAIKAGSSVSMAERFLPPNARMVYDMFRIRNI